MCETEWVGVGRKRSQEGKNGERGGCVCVQENREKTNKEGPSALKGRNRMESGVSQLLTKG